MDKKPDSRTSVDTCEKKETRVVDDRLLKFCVFMFFIYTFKWR